jgi:hypothetical protein
MEKHEINETDLKIASIGGEMLSKPFPIAPSTPSHHLLQNHGKEGVVHPWITGLWK